MRKQSLLFIPVSLVIAATANSAGIYGTKHDLSAGNSANSAYTGTTESLCAYCHVPHGPSGTTSLWNRLSPSNTNYTMYNSQTLTNAAKAAVIPPTSISVFCMSCHDGVTSLGNVRESVGNSKVINSSAPSNISNDLTNDHPIGFRYADAVTQDGALKATPDGAIAGKFYGPNFDQMECASCHSVHDSSYGFFLRINNARSALCLACHNK